MSGWRAMSDYTIVKFEEVPDLTGEYPGEMRMLTRSLDTEQVALTLRRIPPQAGLFPKPDHGHSHKTQEEVYVVVSGRLQFKLGDDIVDVGPESAVRVPPGVVRQAFNEGDEEAVLLIVSKRIEDLRADAEVKPGFWPER
jgi:mannose-6-phosphate isomerase-like protein (cupin superfamily)